MLNVIRNFEVSCLPVYRQEVETTCEEIGIEIGDCLITNLHTAIGDTHRVTLSCLGTNEELEELIRCLKNNNKLIASLVY